MTLRRRFLASAVAIVVPWPIGAQPIKQRQYRITAIYNTPPEVGPHYLRALEDGFRELGYDVGRSLTIEHAFSNGNPDRLMEVVKQAVRRKPDVIITLSNAETAAVQAATRSIPIVIGLGAGPVEAGFAASLAKPGGNITGISTGASADIVAKWLELLREIKPTLSRVAVLWDPTVPGFREFVQSLDATSRKLNIHLHWAELRRAEDLEDLLMRAAKERVEALCVFANSLTFTLRDRIAVFVASHRLPAISYMKEFAEAGFLVSYGADLVQLYKRAAIYADRILKGANPSDLAIEQPTNYQTVVNLRSAKALGVTIPQSIAVRANLLIE